MEHLMKEGAQVEEQIAKSADVMKEVQSAISKFEPLAIVCRKLFVLLAAMREINFLYEFSASTFMRILETVLERTSKEETDEGARMASIKKALFREVAARIGRGLTSEDKMVFALLLARVAEENDSIGASSPEMTLEGIVKIIEETFGTDFPWQGRSLNHLKEVLEDE
eukprot:13355295-Ditylum_brightwellii.AAC.1